MVVDSAKAKGLKVGFTCGAFDLLHAGHVAYLSAARQMCDVLIVAVNSDDSVRAQKGPLRPIRTQEERCALVGALRCVDAVILMSDRRPNRLISMLRPDLYIKGGDYNHRQLNSAPLVEAYGGTVVLIPVRFDVSTSATIKKIVEASVHASPASTSKAYGGLILLDRDGTIIRNIPYLKDRLKVELVPGAVTALTKLQDAGFELAVATNQQGIGLGYLTFDEYVAVNGEMLRKLGTSGVRISRIYTCPHSVADECICRKPQGEMLRRAMADLGHDPGRSYMIGDAESDIAAAADAGIAARLVSESPQLEGGNRESIESAADWILLDAAKSGKEVGQCR